MEYYCKNLIFPVSFFFWWGGGGVKMSYIAGNLKHITNLKYYIKYQNFIDKKKLSVVNENAIINKNADEFRNR
jgi:hypothetical protein